MAEEGMDKEVVFLSEPKTEDVILDSFYDSLQEFGVASQYLEGRKGAFNFEPVSFQVREISETEKQRKELEANIFFLNIQIEELTAELETPLDPQQALQIKDQINSLTAELKAQQHNKLKWQSKNQKKLD
eukprot:TRINITY_DN2180_c0_g2_i1.p1 TRINITY_DN2180_c0_g2~~TRINITY_DN2180_c0_g2_i1.p1  ORF type:complete len:130 (+),score=47.71 TRINITY_DN2180_c0_g2_i1:52-441(+)